MPLPLLPLIGLALSAGGTGYNIFSQLEGKNEQDEYMKKEEERQAIEKAAQEKAERQAAMARAIGGPGIETKGRTPTEPTPLPYGTDMEQGISGSIANVGSQLFSDPEKYYALLRRLGLGASSIPQAGAQAPDYLPSYNA